MLGDERIGGGDEGRKVGELCEKLGVARGAGCAMLGAGRYEGGDCEKLGDVERNAGGFDGVGDGDGIERTGGCCCAKPELGGVRKLGAGVGCATLGGLCEPNDRDDERASNGRGGTGVTPWT